VWRSASENYSCIGIFVRCSREFFFPNFQSPEIGNGVLPLNLFVSSSRTFRRFTSASFEVNRKEAAQPWFFKGWFPRGEWELTRFPELPDLAHYFDDPSCLVYDARRDFRVNIEHTTSETPRERFPQPHRLLERYALQTVVNGAIDNARERVHRSYKTAIPQYYRGQIQILLPLPLNKPQGADLALVVERDSTFHRASTCLTLDMAYNNARQLARPDRD
jgi:hypothetical protein